MTEQNFADQSVIVTGAASGIGNAVATYFAERGARVFGVDRNDAVGSIMPQLPGTAEHHGIVADLTMPGAAETVVAEVVGLAGTIEVLVNSAGVALLDSAVDLSAEKWQRTIDINLSGSFFMAQAAGRVMIEAGYGRIVNLASQASVIGLEGHVAYSASKAGLLGMTKVLAMEWARSGVTVNCVSPTVVETPLGLIAWAGEVGEDMKSRIPVGRFAKTAEIAGLVGYLASREAAMVTGDNVLIDGGYSSV